MFSGRKRSMRKLSHGNARTRLSVFRVSRMEEILIREAAQKSGLTLSAFARRAVLKRTAKTLLEAADESAGELV